MNNEISIKEFRESGALWYINQQLHLFGMAITVDADENGEPTRMYPTRCKFRGFDTNTNDKGYKRMTYYMVKNADELLKDCD